MSVICQKFGLQTVEPDEVKLIDRVVTVNELWTFIDDSYVEDGIVELWDYLEVWDSKRAKEEFLKRFEELVSQNAHPKTS